jgi:hypothetical protein
LKTTVLSPSISFLDLHSPDSHYQVLFYIKAS